MKILYAAESHPYPLRIDGAAKTSSSILKRLVDYPDIEVATISSSSNFSQEYNQALERFNPDVVWSDSIGLVDILSKARKAGHAGLGYIHSPMRTDIEILELDSLGVKMVCCSPYLSKRIASRTRVIVDVVYPLVEDCRVKYNPDGYIVMVGTAKEKGIRTLWAIAKALPHRKFLLVESWKLSEHRLMSLNRRIEYHKNVRFVKSVLDMKEIYSQASLILVPSSWEEPHCMVVREAQQSGIPIIASCRGGLPDTVGKAGTIIDDYLNPVSWVNAIGSQPLEYDARGPQNVSRYEFEAETSLSCFLCACERAIVC